MGRTTTGPSFRRFGIVCVLYDGVKVGAYRRSEKENWAKWTLEYPFDVNFWTCFTSVGAMVTFFELLTFFFKDV